MHVARRLVLAQALEARMPQPTVTRPLGKGDLRHELRLEPHRAFALLARHLLEGRACAFERLELPREPVEVRRIEAGADLAGIGELAVLERAEQKRGERLALHVGTAIAADDEFLAARAFDLEPVLAAPRDVGPVGPLRDDAFEPRRAGLRVELRPRALHVIGIDEKIRYALRRQQFGKLRATFLQRLLAPILAVEVEQIEHEIADRGVRRVDMLLQRFEIGDAGGQHEGNLAVDHRDLRRQAEQRLGDRRKAHRPVEPAPAEQRDFVAGLARDDAVAVIFHFMQPVAAGRHLGVERGELRLDEWRDQRAGDFFRLGFAVAARLAAGVFF